MGIIRRQSIKGSIVTYIGTALGAAMNIFMFPYLLGTTLFGLLQVLLSIMQIISRFAHLGMPNAVVRFFPYFRDKERGHNGLLFFSLAVTTAGFLLSIVLYVAGRPLIETFYSKNSALFVEYYYYALPLGFAFTFFMLFEFYSRALFRVVVPNLIREVIMRLMIVVIVLLYFFFEWSTPEFLFSYTAVYLLSLLLLVGYVSQLDQLYLKPNFRMFSRFRMKAISHYAAFMTLSGAAGMIVVRVDILMLGAMLSLESVAVYSVAYFIGTFIEIPKRLISAISSAVIADAWRSRDMDRIFDIYRKSSVNQLVAGGFAFVLIWVNADNLISLLPADYEQGKYVILFIALSRLIDMITGVNSEILSNSKHYKVNFYLTAGLIAVTAGTNLLFIPMYGVTGAAMATAISLLLLNLLKWFYIKVRFNMQPFGFGVVKGILVIFASLAISQLLPFVHSVWMDLIVRSAVCGLAFVGLTYFTRVSDEANDFIEKTVSRSLGMIRRK